MNIYYIFKYKTTGKKITSSYLEIWSDVYEKP